MYVVSLSGKESVQVLFTVYICIVVGDYLRIEVPFTGFVDIGGIVDHHCLNFLLFC